MTVIARLPFQSRRDPVQQGELILSDDGTIRLEPSEALRDSLAAQEEAALQTANRYGTGLGLTLLGLGLVGLAAGWVAGRIFGKIGYTVCRPRKLEEVVIEPTEDGGLHLHMPGWKRLPSPPQTTWTGEEISLQGREAFLEQVHLLTRPDSNS